MRKAREGTGKAGWVDSGPRQGEGASSGGPGVGGHSAEQERGPSSGGLPAPPASRMRRSGSHELAPYCAPLSPQQPEAGGCGAPAQRGGVGLGPDLPKRLHGRHVLRRLGAAQGARGRLVSGGGGARRRHPRLHPGGVVPLRPEAIISASLGCFILSPAPFPVPLFLSHCFFRYLRLSISSPLLMSLPLPWVPPPPPHPSSQPPLSLPLWSPSVCQVQVTEPGGGRVLQCAGG